MATGGIGASIYLNRAQNLPLVDSFLSDSNTQHTMGKVCSRKWSFIQWLLINHKIILYYIVVDVSEYSHVYLTPLHSEWPKLHRVLAILNAIGLNPRNLQKKFKVY